VFSQAGKALLDNGTGVDPLGGLRAKRLIAIGQSQSSARLTTLISTVHGLTLEPVYDGFIPHAGGGAPTRFPAPVLKLNSENEGFILKSDALRLVWDAATSDIAK
jgi:hypothetical protein